MCSRQCISTPNPWLCSPGIVPWCEPSPGGEENHEICLKTALPELKCECRLIWILSHRNEKRKWRIAHKGEADDASGAGNRKWKCDCASHKPELSIIAFI